jgi:hypothetical protein
MEVNTVSLNQPGNRWQKVQKEFSAIGRVPDGMFLLLNTSVPGVYWVLFSAEWRLRW